MRQIRVAAIQMACTDNIGENTHKAESLVRKAAENGAKIVLLQELFTTPYFCQVEDPKNYTYAQEADKNLAVSNFSQIAKELQIVLPISFYERFNNALYNSVAMIDADGSLLGIYRKSHIPDGPGYEEKFYFNPGDTGFKVWQTNYGKIGLGICWDQWFPETARCLALMGAEMLLYPTAIGSEPQNSMIDSKEHWQICMRGHAAANLIPVIAANRVGTEKQQGSSIDFYGSSFIAGPHGEIVAEADRHSETVIYADFDLDELDKQRIEWGVFRDRRPELYKALITLDGERKIDR